MRDSIFFFFFFNDTATTEIYTLSLHDALPILRPQVIPDHGERRVPPPEVQQQERHLIVPVRRVGIGGIGRGAGRGRGESSVGGVLFKKKKKEKFERVGST